MRTSRTLVSLFAIVLALYAVACFDTYQTNSQGQGGTGSNGGGGVVSPDLPSAITAVAVSKFGEDQCDNPTNNSGTVRVGCLAHLTCTPKCGDRDCTPAEHGSSPEFFGIVAGAAYVQVSGNDNLYNLDVRGVGPSGSNPGVQFSCTVKGIQSIVRTLEVVN